ncbi:MAG: T9SS type A sorting domain-containing protein, partial [Salibacteraceae bacterium]
FSSPEDRIQRHLIEAHRLLSQNANSTSESRVALLSELKQYAEKRQFPKNTKHSIQIPYFIDDFNTPCAVANLMLANNSDDLAYTIQDNYNYRYIKEMPQSLVNTWASEAGFETWELALIQPAYDPKCPPVRWIPENDFEPNGPVHHVNFNSESENLCMAGAFTSENGSCFVCVNNGVVNDFEGPLSGEALDFVEIENRFFVAGNFSSDRGLAMSIEQAFVPVGTGNNLYESHAVTYDDRYIYFDAYLSGFDSSIVYKMHIDSTVPQQLFSVNGKVNDLLIDREMVIAAGLFSKAYLLENTFPCNNFIALTPSVMSTMECSFQGEIFTLSRVEDLLYVAGDCTFDSTDTSSCIIAHDDIGNWHDVLDSNRFMYNPMWGVTDYNTIYDLYEYKDTLFVGGVLDNSGGSNLMYISDSQLVASACFNQPVRSLSTNKNGYLLCAGSFTENTHGAYYGAPYHLNSTTSLKYVAFKADYLTGVEEELSDNPLRAFPNPASTEIRMEGIANTTAVNVYDITGKRVDAPVHNSSTIVIDVSNLVSGIYVLEAELQDRSKKRMEFVVKR